MLLLKRFIVGSVVGSVLLLFLLLSGVPIARAQDDIHPLVVPPNTRVQGLTQGEWSARWWQYIFSIPAPSNPLNGGTGTHCVFQKIGRVLLLGWNPQANTPLSCTVPAETILFVPLVTVECSTLEPPPFHGNNPRELRECATGFPISDLRASLDGVAIQNLSQYIAVSPLYQFTVPDNNILGVPGPARGLSVANGPYLMFLPLSPGRHTIYIHGSLPTLSYTDEATFDLTVLPDD